uniref:Phage protein n=1 Tax=Escherichia phage fDHCT2 TaxID=3075956 RepID=A0AB38Z2F7_9CAUD
MTLDEFKKSGLELEHDCLVLDDDNEPNTIKFWFEAVSTRDTNELIKVYVATDWAVEFSFNVMVDDTPETLIHMAESCIKDAYNDENV